MPTPSRTRLMELMESYIASLEHLVDVIALELRHPRGKTVTRGQYIEAIEQADELLRTYAAALLVAASESQLVIMSELASSLMYQFLTKSLPGAGLGHNLYAVLSREYLDPFLLEREIDLHDIELPRPELLDNTQPGQYYAWAYEYELVYLLDGVRLVTATQAFLQADRAEGQAAELFMKLASMLLNANPSSEYGEPGHFKAEKLYRSGDRFIERLLTMLFAGQDFLDTRPDSAKRHHMWEYLERFFEFTGMAIPEKMISGRIYSGWGQQWPNYDVLALVALNSGGPPDKLPKWIDKIEAGSPGRPGLERLAKQMRDANAKLTFEHATELLPAIGEKLVGDSKEEEFAKLNEGWSSYWLRILDFIESQTPIQVSQTEVSEKRIIDIVYEIVTSFVQYRILPKLLDCRFEAFPRGWDEWGERKELSLIVASELVNRLLLIGENQPRFDMSGRSFAADELRLCLEKVVTDKDKAIKIQIEGQCPEIRNLADAIESIKEANELSCDEVANGNWLLLSNALPSTFYKSEGFVSPWDEQRLREVLPTPAPTSLSSHTCHGVWVSESIPLVQYHLIPKAKWPEGTMILLMRESVGEMVTEEYPDVIFNPTPTHRRITLDFRKTLEKVVINPETGEMASMGPLEIVPGSDVIGGPIFEETIENLSREVDIRLHSQLIISLVQQVAPLQPTQMVVFGIHSGS